jgi:hypothetical protein
MADGFVIQVKLHKRRAFLRTARLNSTQILRLWPAFLAERFRKPGCVQIKS